MKKIEITSLILKEKFKQHFIYKEKIINLIKDSISESLIDNKNGNNDFISKLDWPLANNWERPWVKLISPFIYEQLNNFSLELGFTSCILNQLWFQQYTFQNIHNWHCHGGNYTGVYYLEFDKQSPKTEILYPNNLNEAFTINVEEGDIIIFPCYFIHRSGKIVNNKRKTIISFNIDFDRILEKYTHDRVIKNEI
jgi:hypothetical protein